MNMYRSKAVQVPITLQSVYSSVTMYEILLGVLQLVEELRQYGLTLLNYASIREQSIGGFIQVRTPGLVWYLWVQLSTSMLSLPGKYWEGLR
jgi:hypothetical protein